MELGFPHQKTSQSAQSVVDFQCAAATGDRRHGEATGNDAQKQNTRRARMQGGWGRGEIESLLSAAAQEYRGSQGAHECAGGLGDWACYADVGNVGPGRAHVTQLDALETDVVCVKCGNVQLLVGGRKGPGENVGASGRKAGGISKEYRVGCGHNRRVLHQDVRGKAAGCRVGVVGQKQTDRPRTRLIATGTDENNAVVGAKESSAPEGAGQGAVSGDATPEIFYPCGPRAIGDVADAHRLVRHADRRGAGQIRQPGDKIHLSIQRGVGCSCIELLNGN